MHKVIKDKRLLRCIDPETNKVYSVDFGDIASSGLKRVDLPFCAKAIETIVKDNRRTGLLKNAPDFLNPGTQRYPTRNKVTFNDKVLENNISSLQPMSKITNQFDVKVDDQPISFLKVKVDELDKLHSKLD